MNRREAIKQTAYASAYALFFSQLLACKSGDKVAASEVKEAIRKLNLNLPVDAPFQMDYIKGNVGYFTERGGTIGWMIEEGHLVIVDTQFPEQSQHVVDSLMANGGSHIDLLINTHHHGDHTSGNIIYKDLTDRIVAHENSKKNQMVNAKRNSNEDKQLYPNELFADSWATKIGGETITMDYFGAAHTDGDAITHFQNANVVHMGDLVFNRRFPYIDKSAGANISSWIDVLDKALNKFDGETKFIFGHSDNGYEVTGDKEDIKAFQNYLTQLLLFGEQSIKAGKSIEEVKLEATEIPGAPQWKGKGIERSLDAVYAELG